jgi:hypothetical protein
MTKIGDIKAAVMHLFKIGHREAATGTRRTDRNRLRESTRPVKSRTVRFAADIEGHERETIEGQQEPAARDDRRQFREPTEHGKRPIGRRRRPEKFPSGKDFVILSSVCRLSPKRPRKPIAASPVDTVL